MKPMTVLRMFLIFALAISTNLALSAEPEKSVHIDGAVSNPSDWTTAHLKEQFASELKQIQYTSKGQQHTSICVALLSVLKAAGAQTDLKMDPTADPKTKNIPLRLAVVVRGNDGYTVVLSLAELLPQIRNEEAWLALDADGNALSDRDGPAKLIVPSDKKPGRSVHGIATISVLDLASATTEPTTRP
jgi:hypothetical protein